ncbi:MAG TPA: hypothetical protein VHG08_20355 [Longimicrobium sp.]|nr:hypothetical protein [Longimicrobium sp.]
MDAGEDPGGVVLPTVFYGLWPRGGVEAGEADDATSAELVVRQAE